VIFAVAAAAALTVPSREALAERWLRANRAHTVAQLRLVRAAAAPPADLTLLAQRELAIAGRYQLTESSAPPAESLWARAMEWLSARWQELWKRLFARAHVGGQAITSIGDVMLVLVAVLLLFVLVRLLTNLQIERSRAKLAYEPLRAAPDPHSLYVAARRAAKTGDYGHASLLLFAATIALLDVRGTVHGDPSATVGEVRRELRSRDAALISPFDAIAAPFVQKAYAERAVGAPEWDRARDAFVTLLAQGAQA
jgi:hypothetical protein